MRRPSSARDWDVPSRVRTRSHTGRSRPVRGDRRRHDISDPRDVVICAAGSMPGDLHKLWRSRDPKGYHVEYGYSCMGYEIAGVSALAWRVPTVMCS